MTDEEKAAIAFLREKAENGLYSFRHHCATILAMLAEPRLPRPEDVPPTLLSNMATAYFKRGVEGDMRAAYRALYDHYTKARTVWRVECVGKLSRNEYNFPNQEAAMAYANWQLLDGNTVTITKGDA